LRTSDRRQFAGTLPYMSVEQLECREELGPATDIYAFGVVLYEMLTQSLPFEGDTLSAVLVRQLKERPKPPSRHVPGLSPALDRFVLRCLHRDPRQRFMDAGHALTALSAIRDWSRLSGRAKIARTAVPLAAIVVLAAVVYASGRRDAEPGVTEAAAQHEPVLEQVTHALFPSEPVGEVSPNSPREAPPALLEASSNHPVSAPHDLAAALPAAHPGVAPAAASRAPESPALEPGAPTAPSVAGAVAEAPPPSTTTLAGTGALTGGAVAAPAKSASSARPGSAKVIAAPSAAEPSTSSAWKPERVPKRLSVPTAGVPTAGVPTAGVPAAGIPAAGIPAASPPAASSTAPSPAR
jgi:hypothetical protein